MKRILVVSVGAALMALYVALPAVVQADQDLNQKQARALLREGKIRPLEALMALHPQRLAGRLLDVELERDDGVLVYEIEVLGRDGVVREFDLDAATGEVLDEEVDD